MRREHAQHVRVARNRTTGEHPKSARSAVPTPALTRSVRAEPSERNVSVLAPWPRLLLRQRGLERVDEDAARAAGLDHLVDVAALGGRVRVREALAVVLDQLFAPRLGVGGIVELLAEDD